jgi:hypothetical protein
MDTDTDAPTADGEEMDVDGDGCTVTAPSDAPRPPSYAAVARSSSALRSSTKSNCHQQSAVVFTSHDEVSPERVNPDGTTTTTIQTQLANVFSATMARKHTLFIKIMFQTTASKNDPTKTARAQLMEYHKMLQAIDETAILYKLEHFNVTKADACLKPTALPTTLTGLQSYADSLCPSADGGDCWCNIRVGFNKSPDEFMAELRAQAGTRKWVAKKQPLQSAHTENVGWINYLLQSTDVDFWAECINTWIDKHIERKDDTPPLVIGLNYLAIYDGLGQAAWNCLSQKIKCAKKAFMLSANAEEYLFMSNPSSESMPPEDEDSNSSSRTRGAGMSLFCVAIALALALGEQVLDGESGASDLNPLLGLCARFFQ